MKGPSISELYDLTGQSAIVTGGAMGIGKSIVNRLSEAGAAVLIVDSNVETGQQTKQELIKMGRKVEFVETDTSNLSDIEKAINFSKKIFGGIDILINNAGIFPFMPALEVTESFWDRLMEINLKGAFFFAQKTAKTMVEKGKHGRIINIASIDAYHPTGNLAHYDASKGGLVMLTKSLALEWARHGIQVNAIAPGGIRTPGADQSAMTMIKASGIKPEQLADLSKTFTARIPLGRQGEADEIATVALFLASQAASYITGEIIIVDGGYLLG